MAQKLKTWLVLCSGGKYQALEVEIDAINGVQAKEFAQARYPNYKRYATIREKR